MNTLFRKVFLFCLPLGIVPPALSAEAIRFDNEELSQETVLPKLGDVPVVMERHIQMARKIELSPGFGFNFTEPIYNPLKYHFGFGYHWSEVSGILLQYTKWATGKNSQYANQLEGDGIGLKLDRIPAIDSSIFINYETRLFYGKMSLTKNTVVNVHFYPLFGLGTTKYIHKSYFGGNVGIGSKFYFSKNFALRADFYFQFIQGPNPFSPGEKLAFTDNQVVTADFKDKWNIGNHLDLSFSIFF